MQGYINRAHYNNRLHFAVAIDDETLVSIWQQYYKNVYNYISYRINNHHDSEELASTVFENAIRKFSTYDPEKASVEAWLIGIAKNTITDYFRRRSKRLYLPLEKVTDIVSGSRQPEDVAVLNEEHRILIEVMAKLKEKDRQVLAMRFATDLKTNQIAELLGLSESNVGVIIHRSVKKLKRIMEKEGGFYEK